MAYPAGFKYTKDHEWIDLSGDKGKVGITDYAQQQLGDVVYVELPDARREAEAGSVVRGRSNRVKAVCRSSIRRSTGEIVEVNRARSRTNRR